MFLLFLIIICYNYYINYLKYIKYKKYIKKLLNYNTIILLKIYKNMLLFIDIFIYIHTNIQCLYKIHKIF